MIESDPTCADDEDVHDHDLVSVRDVWSPCLVSEPVGQMVSMTSLLGMVGRKLYNACCSFQDHSGEAGSSGGQSIAGPNALPELILKLKRSATCAPIQESSTV